MIKIYGSPDCPYCKELKELLIKEGIEFTDVDVNLPENREECDKIFEITKSDMIPVARVNKQLFVPEVSFKSIKECFETMKKFL